MELFLSNAGVKRNTSGLMEISAAHLVDMGKGDPVISKSELPEKRPFNIMQVRCESSSRSAFYGSLVL